MKQAELTSTKRIHLDPEPERNHDLVQPVTSMSVEEAMGGGEGISLLQPPPNPVVSAPAKPYKHLPSFDNDDDWKYSMRRQMQETIPGLFLGPYAAAAKSSLQALKDVGITHIVCVRHIMERHVIRPVHEGHFTYLVLEMGDDDAIPLIPYCNRVIKFIDSCFASGGKVLVHGNGGINRSAALVTAYIMATYGVGLKKTQQFVLSKRFAANPSRWLTAQLQEYEAIYQAMHDLEEHPLPMEGETTRPPIRKRAFDDISCDNDDIWGDELLDNEDEEMNL